MGTFILVFVVLETAVDSGNKANRLIAALAIGLAVFLAHSVLISVDGCSINPTRSTGPALTAMLVPYLDKLMAATEDAAAKAKAAADKANEAANSARAAAANPTDLANAPKVPSTGMVGGDAVSGGLTAGAGAQDVSKLSPQEQKEEMERRIKEQKDELERRLKEAYAIMFDLMMFWSGPLFGAWLAADVWESLP